MINPSQDSGVKPARVALLVACMALFLPSSMGMAQVVGKITGLKPSVMIERNGREFAAGLNEDILLRDVVRTGIGGRAKVVLKDEVMLTVAENTAVEITEHLFDEKKNWRNDSLHIQKGLIRLLLRMYGQDSNFVVNSGNAVAGAKGTDFLVRYDPTPARELTQVYVLEGIVDVHNRLKTIPGLVRLTANEWSEVLTRQRPKPPHKLSREAADALRNETSLAEQVTKASKKNFGSATAKNSDMLKQQGALKRKGPPVAKEAGNPYVDIVGQDMIFPGSLGGGPTGISSQIAGSSAASSGATGPFTGGPVSPSGPGPAIGHPSGPGPGGTGK